MDITLDTHAVLWYSLEDDKLSSHAHKIIKEASLQDRLLISTITLWEIAWIVRKDRIRLKVPYLEYINTLLKMDPYEVIEITPEIAATGANLDSSISSDPADRIIAATALIFDTPLVTADKNLRKSTLVKTIW